MRLSRSVPVGHGRRRDRQRELPAAPAAAMLAGGRCGRVGMQGLLTQAEALAVLLRARGETVAVAESSAGGLIAAALLAQPGASAFFLGGAIVYTRQARGALL